MRMHLKPDQFLSVLRDEKLERLLRIVAAGDADNGHFVYHVSQAGDEVRGNAIISHISIDSDLSYKMVVDATDGTLYRVSGFDDSFPEFNRLMSMLRVQAAYPDKAQAVAELYREINPERMSIAPVKSLLELKQAAELWCHAVHSPSFEDGESAFDIGWSKAKRRYGTTKFAPSATRRTDGYLTEWIFLSSPSADLYGGAPLRGQLIVREDGQVEELRFVPLQRN